MYNGTTPYIHTLECNLNWIHSKSFEATRHTQKQWHVVILDGRKIGLAAAFITK